MARILFKVAGWIELRVNISVPHWFYGGIFYAVERILIVLAGGIELRVNISGRTDSAAKRA